MFRMRCACLLLCVYATTGAGQTPVLRGRWVQDQHLTPMSLEFRGGDTVWEWLPLAQMGEKTWGTYKYAGGQLIRHWSEGVDDTAGAILRGDTLVLMYAGVQTEADPRFASARGARSPVHGTWAVPDGDLMTYLPSGVFFKEGLLVQHYTLDATTLTIPMADTLQLHIEIRGADTLLTMPDSFGGEIVFRRPHCNDPRLDPRKSLTSVCS